TATHRRRPPIAAHAPVYGAHRTALPPAQAPAPPIRPTCPAGSPAGKGTWAPPVAAPAPRITGCHPPGHHPPVGPLGRPPPTGARRLRRARQGTASDRRPSGRPRPALRRRDRPRPACPAPAPPPSFRA